MNTADLDLLLAAIDAVVKEPNGGPKISAPALNGLLRQLATDLAGSALPAPQLAALDASHAPAADNAYLTQADLAPLDAATRYPAEIVRASGEHQAYATIFEAVAAARPGEAVGLRAPLHEPVGPTTEAVIDLLPDVCAHLHGYDISSPSPTHDIVTLRGGRNVLYGGHATLTQRDPGGGAGAWFVGAYGGTTLDATLLDLHLRLSTYKSVGFALFATGICTFRGSVHSVGRYVARLSPGALALTFAGEGSIWQQGGTIFWLQGAAARAEWRGDITALDTALFNLEAGTVVLRQGYLHAETRPAGAELVVQGSPSSTLILENYTFGGVPGATVGHVGTLVLRGSTVVIGNILADKVIDERPTASSAGLAAGAPAAPAPLTLPSPVPARVAQFAPAGARTAAAYELTRDGGATWAPATSFTLPVPAEGVAGGLLGVRVAATPEGVPASAATYLPATGPVRTTVGLRARYYAGSFGGDPAFFRGKQPLFEETLAHAGRFQDPVFDNFGRVYGSLDQFSVLYEGQLLITEAGDYSFGFYADDRGGIWLGAEATADPRTDNRADNTGPRYLAAGLHPLLLAYGEYGGAQHVDYYWQGPGVSDILNAGRLRLFTNEPAPAPAPAPPGLLPSLTFAQPLGKGPWTAARGWDVVEGVLLGTDTGQTSTNLAFPIPQLADAYTLEVSLTLAPGAQLLVSLDGLTPAATRLTTSGVHQLAVVPAQVAGQLLLSAEGSQLVQVHYVQLLRSPTVVTGNFVEDTSPRLSYTGTWQTETNQETVYRDGAGKYVNPGDAAAVELTFSGTQFAIWACTSAAPTDGYTTGAQLFIDGQPLPQPLSQQVANPSGNPTYSWAWYTSPVLPAGPHTVRLAADPALGQYLVFDGFELMGEFSASL